MEDKYVSFSYTATNKFNGAKIEKEFLYAPQDISTYTPGFIGDVIKDCRLCAATSFGTNNISKEFLTISYEKSKIDVEVPLDIEVIIERTFSIDYDPVGVMSTFLEDEILEKYFAKKS